ncbi:SLBB domain-containing protein, partial [Myxococcota bacterium]|nr:SLBB domain-containing protein [Myxococcota bacterium]
AVGARRGVIFIRHEYEPERRSLEEALEAARRAGLVGRASNFEIEIFVSPGGYILGEETALLECLEDRRGEPRNKPPYPGQIGLWGKPTLINNVETFAHATAILAKGVDWWKQQGLGPSSGHKFVSVSGDVARAGVQLVPFGSSFADLLEACGGMIEGADLLAFAPGGASSRFLGPEELSVPIDFDAVAQAGSMLGSGAVVFVASGRDLQSVGLSLTRFFRNESCGKCVPCRLGTDQAVRRIETEGGVSRALRKDLESLSETLAQTSLCGLGQVALEPLLSLCARFPDQFGGD